MVIYFVSMETWVRERRVKGRGERVNKIEIIALLLPLEKLCERGDFEGVTSFIKEILKEVRRE